MRRASSDGGPTWTLFPDRPVGLDDDLLWAGDPIQDEIKRIAERVVRPLYGANAKHGDEHSFSITFAVHGRWGMGKSSVLRMLREAAIRQAKRHSCQDRLVFCEYVASAYESLGQDVRMTLVVRLLTALAGGSAAAVERFLRDTGAQDVLPQNLDTTTPHNLWSAQALENAARMVARVMDFDKLLEAELMGSSHATSPDDPGSTRVLVVIVDDLDRCQSPFTWQVIDTIQQLSNVPNLFFVIAVEEEKLREAVAFHLGSTENPDQARYAMEKYVQHAVYVPDLSEAALNGFVSQLVRRYGTGDPVSDALVKNAQFVTGCLPENTPRSVKRCLTAIRSNLLRKLMGANSDAERTLIVKEQALQYMWPDFHREYVLPAKVGGETRYAQAFLSLEQICSQFAQSRDKGQFAFSLDRIVTSFGVAWGDLDLNLARYLGLPPFWRFRRGSGPGSSADAGGLGPDGGAGLKTGGSPSGMQPDFYRTLEPSLDAPLPTGDAALAAQLPNPEFEDNFLQMYFRSEEAEADNRAREAVYSAQLLYDFAAANVGRMTPTHAQFLGNAAVTAEKFDAVELATRLYRLAIKLDADHINNIQNFVDFIVNTPVPELYDDAWQMIRQLKAPPFASQRPERTLALEVRLGQLTGRETNVSTTEVVASLLAEVRQHPASDARWASAFTVLRQLVDFPAAEEVSKAHYLASDVEQARYRTLRALADMLADSGGDTADTEAKEMQALEIYRHLLEHEDDFGAAARDQRTQTMHNYATLLYKHNYDAAAGRVWYEAYNAAQLQSTRRAYGLYLVRAGRADLAQRVAQGELLSEMVLLPSDPSLPERFVGKDVDRWWETPPPARAIS